MPANFVDKTIWTGDNLDILRGMNSESVDLIYLDPPFNSNRDYAAPVGSKAAGAAFKDTWTLSDLDIAWMGLIADEHPAIYRTIEAAGMTHGKGMQSYLCMMAVRLLEMRRVLKDTGSLYLHCDPTAGHYIKLLMDAVLEHRNFIDEIVWNYGTPSGGRASGKKPIKTHETLLVYAKHYGNHTYNRLYTPYSEKYVTNWFRHEDEDGRKYRTRSRNGKIVRQYLDESPGVPLSNVWSDIMQLYGSAGWFPRKDDERVGYPTQKPLALLERIIGASSNEGDMVLDPFAGCATACVAADKLGRQWVGIDLSPKAVELVNIRLRDYMGDLFHDRLVTARTDIPRRTDIDAPVHYRKNKHVLFGQQEGQCNGCRMDFPFKVFAVDHIIPRSRGGSDHMDNLQLLCGHCNSIKGDRPQEYLVARLKELGTVIT